MICQLRIGFPLMGDGGHVIAELSGVIREDDRKPAVAGNQTQPFAAFHVRRLRHERLFLVFFVLAHRPADAPFGPFEKREDGHHVRLIAKLRFR